MLTVAQSRKHPVNNLQLTWEDAPNSSWADAAVRGCCSKWRPWSKKYSPTQTPCQHSRTQEHFINQRCAFRLIGCLILVFWLLSRPAFMPSFVSLLETWGGVTGRSLSRKASSSYREMMFIIFKKHAVFQSHVHERFQTCDVTWCHLFRCSFPPAVTGACRAGNGSQKAVVEVCRAAAPPTQTHLIHHPDVISGLVEHPQSLMDLV